MGREIRGTAHHQTWREDLLDKLLGGRGRHLAEDATAVAASRGKAKSSETAIVLFVDRNVQRSTQYGDARRGADRAQAVSLHLLQPGGGGKKR